MRPDAWKIFQRLSVESQAYVVLFVAIAFSGSVFGAAVPYLIVVELGLLLWMYATPYRLVGGYRNKKHLGLLITFLVFCGYLLWQTTMAFDPTFTAIYLRRYLFFSLLLLLLPRPDVALCTIVSSKHYSLAVSASIIALAVATGTKTGGLVGNYQFGGMMASIACILFLVDYYWHGGRGADALGFVLSVVALAITGKRMFMLIAVLAFFGMHLIVRRPKRIGRTVALGAAVVAAAGLGYVYIGPARDIVVRFALFLQDPTTATSGRDVLWTTAWEIFRTHMITGIGFANFVPFSGAQYSGAQLGLFHTHNIYLGLLAETGLIGFGLFVGFMATAFGMSWKLLRAANCEGGASLGFVMTYSMAIQSWFIIYGFSGNGIYDWHEFFFYMSAVAMMLSVRIRMDEVRNTARVASLESGDL